MLEPDDDINSISPLHLVIRQLFGRVENIQGSGDRYLVVDKNNKKVINVFDKLWKFTKDGINRLIKRNDEITFGNADNKISVYNKLRFSYDVDLPLDTLIEFHMLTVVINCVIEKGNKYYPEIYLDGCFYKTDILENMISLDIKNKLFTLFGKVVNILDFNPKKISIQKAGSGDMCIYYINYNKNPFDLAIDDLKGYFKENNGNKYLTMIFKPKSQKMMYTRIWEEIKKVINEVDEFSNYDRNYDIISFDTDDILSLNSIINIYSITIIIKAVFKDNNKFYPQIYLADCRYNEI